MVEQKLNVNIPEAAFRLETLIERILPRSIFYKLLLRGKGLEFDGYRDLGPDDDSSTIDWKASTRANKYLVKQYVEERDIKILFVIDVSDNMVFGSHKKLKCECAAEVAGALGKVLLNDPRDQLGYVFFNEEIVEIMMPEPGLNQYNRFIHQLSDPKTYGGMSNLKSALDRVMERIDPSLTLIVLISDFINIDVSYKGQLEDIAAYIETIAIMIKDPLDLTLPDIDKEVVIQDPATGERLLMNPKVAKKIYEENAKIQEHKTRKLLRDCNIDNVRIITNKDFCPKIALFLKNRSLRRD